MSHRVVLALVVLAVCAPPAGATGTYAGWLYRPGNDDTMVVTTNDAGTKVRSVVMAFRADCADGQKFAFHRSAVVRSTVTGKQAILKPARNSRGRFAAAYGGLSYSDQFSFKEYGTFRGTFKRRNASGRIAITIDVTDANGAAVTTCKSGSMRFTAQRGRGRYYGGTTAQGEPVTMVLTSTRRMVWDFGIGWHATCSNDGFVDIPDVLTEFRISRSRFGDTWSVRNAAGRWDYGLRGALTRSRASGTFSASVTDRPRA